jgi:signal transduction histidine kinase
MDLAHVGPSQLRRLLDAVIAIGEDLDLSVLLQRIVDAGRDLVGARYAALGVLDRSGTSLAEFITAGMSDEDRAVIGALPKGHGILGVLITTPEPIRLADISEHPDRFGFPPGHPPMTSFLGVPLFVHGEVFGNLYFTEKLDGEVFTDIDEELATGLAAAAAGVIANARLHERDRELTIVEDRERLGRALHESVVRQLFSIGVGMHTTVRLCDDPSTRARLAGHVDQLDEVIRTVRTAVFEMERRPERGAGVRQQLLSAVAESGEAIGVDPVVLLDGPIDASVGPELGADVVAVARDALVEMAAPGETVAIDVRLCVTPDAQSLHLEIRVDGSGGAALEPAGARFDTIRRRAHDRQGTAQVVRGRRGGATLRWSVPLADADGVRR